MTEKELLEKVIKLGDIIRGYQAEGQLQSVPPPTIYGYLSLLRLARGLSHLSLKQVAFATLLGNASPEDYKIRNNAFYEAFGLRNAQNDDDPTLAGDLF
jgi:hypothetical protein